MLNYMDRSALSITAPLIEKELGFNAAEMGMIFSAFFIGYALFNFIGGWPATKLAKNGFPYRSVTMVCFLWVNRSGHRIVDNAYRARSFRYG
ncbi:membrane transport protein [Salmonella enterica subsp. diarizonae]|uniref:Membrane transport protein n=1 Tax=Salmonella diarizonae TaxID=59204 RepID=A0A379TZV1_SALDZ|nr:membrane transport protein [Salmonella enterica subsp. diarizonae]